MPDLTQSYIECACGEILQGEDEYTTALAAQDHYKTCTEEVGGTKVKDDLPPEPDPEDYKDRE